MPKLSEATFPRAICNAKPRRWHTIFFVPSMKRMVDEFRARLRAKGIFVPTMTEPMMGAQSHSKLRGLEIQHNPVSKRIFFGVVDLSDRNVELTAHGPKLVRGDGKERQGEEHAHILLDPELVDADRIRSIIACSLAEGSNFRPFYLRVRKDRAHSIAGVGEIDRTTELGHLWYDAEWEKERVVFGLTTDHALTDSLTSREKAGYKMFFTSEVVEMDAYRVEHLDDDQEPLEDGRWHILSRFRAGALTIRISTIDLTAAYGRYRYETLIFANPYDDLECYGDRYETQAEAERAHWEIVNKIKAEGKKALNGYVGEQTLQNAEFEQAMA